MDEFRHNPAPDTPGNEVAGTLWPDDFELLEGLRAGDESAYETLLSRFQQPVFNLVSRLIEDRAEAGDVTQEVFLKVFRSVSSFRGQSSLKTWIYRIAVNEAHNRRRWFGRHRRPEVGLEGAEDGSRGYLDRYRDPSRSPYDLVLNEEWKEAIQKALADLNPVFRSAVVLRDMEDLSYEDIADVLDISLGTVKSRILRGREGLRKALLEQMEPARAIAMAPQPVE